MKYRSFIYSIYGVGVGVIILCSVVVYHMTALSDTNVVFLNVGQGDAILISQGTNQILIDGGPDSTVLLEELSAYMPFWDRTIEVIVATHPDGDHIDGLIGVLQNYHVQQVWHTNAAKDTATYNMLMHHIAQEHDVVDVIAYKGLSMLLNGALLEVIAPLSTDVSAVDDVNDTSIILLLTVADEVFYFGGDATQAIEDVLPIDHVTVLKASHHGSQSSTSENFLRITQPRDVVISVGADNRYGHPHADVLNRIVHAGAQVLRTDYDGSIEYRCNYVQCVRIFR